MPDVHVYDNGGVTFDRYTAEFPDGDVLLIGPTGNVPNGVCMYAEGGASEDYDGEPVSFFAIPEPVQQAIRAEWNTWFRDEYGEMVVQ